LRLGGGGGGGGRTVARVVVVVEEDDGPGGGGALVGGGGGLCGVGVGASGPTDVPGEPGFSLGEPGASFDGSVRRVGVARSPRSVVGGGGVGPVASLAELDEAAWTCSVATLGSVSCSTWSPATTAGAVPRLRGP
jgi:hypothetical protein